MTQAYNLSQLANNLDSSGRLDATDGLVNALPEGNGGTGASTFAAARANLNVPTRTGDNASGTWNIGISGNAATATNPSSGGSFITSLNIGSQSVNFANSASTATSATNAGNASTVTTVTASQVLSATAAASAGAVGTYAFLVRASQSGDWRVNQLTAGGTVAGSVMFYAGTAGTSGTPSGTWRCMGFMFAGFESEPNMTTFYPTLFLRIS
jgi:hypothetical protein